MPFGRFCAEECQIGIDKALPRSYFNCLLNIVLLVAQCCLFLGKELISCKLSEWCAWLFPTCRTRKRVPLSSPGHPPTKYWMTGCRWECNMRMQCHWDKRRISQGSPSVQWDRIGHLARRTLPQSSSSWFSNLLPSRSQNVQFPQWDECSVSVRSGQAFWTFGGLPSHKVAPIKSECRSADFAHWNAK